MRGDRLENRFTLGGGALRRRSAVPVRHNAIERAKDANRVVHPLVGDVTAASCRARAGARYKHDRHLRLPAVVLIDLAGAVQQRLRHSLPATHERDRHAVPVVYLAGGILDRRRIAVVRGDDEQLGDAVTEQ